MDVLNKISEYYNDLNNSGWGLAYDALNLGLYVAAPFTGGATLPYAMAMTGAQATGAGIDAYQNGFNLNNTLDLASAVPGFGITEKLVKRSMKPVMKSVGKTTKYVKYAPKYLTATDKMTKIVVPKYEKVAHHGGRDIYRWIDHVYNLGKTRIPLWMLAKGNKSYLPIASLIYGEDVLNNGLNVYQVANDIKDINKNKK